MWLTVLTPANHRGRVHRPVAAHHFAVEKSADGQFTNGVAPAILFALSGGGAWENSQEADGNIVTP
jgi:hypothetical protein